MAITLIQATVSKVERPSEAKSEEARPRPSSPCEKQNAATEWVGLWEENRGTEEGGALLISPPLTSGMVVVRGPGNLG